MAPAQLVLILGCGLAVLWIYYVVTWMNAMKKNSQEQTEILRKLHDKESK
jgi:hypothetical protein